MVKGGRPERRADNLTAISKLICLENVGASTSHSPMDLHGLLWERATVFITYYIAGCDTVQSGRNFSKLQMTQKPRRMSFSGK
jgi:hypothetical protein